MRFLVLGFYDRANIGDEAYKRAFPQILGEKPILDFKCTDDVTSTMNISSYDAVLCGGGDIINQYFVDKIRAIKSCEYNIRVPFYALSVGIPYASNARFLDIFDHVFMRSKTDYDLAVAIVGEKNASFTPDAVFALKPVPVTKADNNSYNIAVCIAKPVFGKDKGDVLINKYADYLEKIVVTQRVLRDTCVPPIARVCTVHLFAFNMSQNINENDVELNLVLEGLLKQKNIEVVNHTEKEYTNPAFMIKAFATMDFCVCMRYHSAIFAIMAGKPFTCTFISQKIKNLLQDVKSPPRAHYEIPSDSLYRAASFDVGTAFSAAAFAMNECILHVPVVDNVGITSIVRSLKKREVTTQKIIKIRQMYKWVSQFLIKHNIDVSEISTLPVEHCESLARIISFAATGDLSPKYLWGLVDKLKNDPLHKIMDSFTHIYDECVKEKRDDATFHRTTQHPMACAPTDDFAGYHRSGWNYALSKFKYSSQGVLLDNYVDRTFTWANDALEASGKIPYRVPWVGFIHHTFLESCGKHNMVEVFKNDNFLESLKMCRHLFTLSKHLATQIREALIVAGFPDVKVSSLVHPTETPDLQFSMNRFKNNKSRKVVHVGAWLRNPFAIYDLPIFPSNPIGLHKAALKGKDMDMYFPPTDFSCNVDPDHPQESPSNACRVSAICRPAPSNACRAIAVENKFVAGLVDSLSKKVDSVEIIGNLSNAEYDVLLSENIVFIELVDCSAVNTVIECIVRNTPIFVNRLPALEEVLGKEYPGFYTDLFDGAKKMNLETIHEATVYLSRLKKNDFSLATFKARFNKTFTLL